MRILLLSDIHGNLPALDAVLDAAGDDYDHAWVLGDTVGYGARPSECIAAIRDLHALVVAGNHERAAIGQLPTAHFNPVARAAIEWTAGVLTEDEVAYLAGLALREVSGEFTLVHGSPRDPVWEYMRSEEQAVENLDYFGTAGCALGHSHVPFLVRVLPDGRVEQSGATSGRAVPVGEGRVYLNPGSVGQPRDGDPRASYAVLDPGSRTVTFQRVEYDIPAAQSQILEAGLPELLARRLAAGR